MIIQEPRVEIQDGKRFIVGCPWFIGPSDRKRFADHLQWKITPPQTVKEQQECVNNAWVLCRQNPAFLAHEYMQIRLKSGGRTKFNNWSPGQKQLYRAVRLMQSQQKPVRIIILKSRRQGVSTLCELLAFNATAFNSDTHALIAAHRDKSAAAIYRMFGLFLDSLPDPLAPMLEKDNASEILFDNPKRQERKASPGLGSSIQQLTVALGGGRKEEQGKARGETFQFIHGSECAFWTEPQEFWSGASQCVDESYGTSILLESTANGFGWFYDMWAEASAGWELIFDHRKNHISWDQKDKFASRSSMIPVFLSWMEEPSYVWPFDSEQDRKYLLKDLDKEEKALVKNFKASPEQLNWRRRMLYGEKFNSDLQRFHQEYPTTPDEAFISTGRKVFDIGALRWSEMLIRENYKEPKKYAPIVDEDGFPKLIENESGTLTIYKEPEEGIAYTVGIDACYGKAKGDFACAQILRCATWEQVAIVHGRIAPDEMARICFATARYYNEALAVIETDGPGIHILVQMDEMAYTNLYCRTLPDSISKKPRSEYGWKMSTKSRRNMVAAMQAAVRDMVRGEGLVLHDLPTIRELMQWVVKVSAAGKAKEAPASGSGYDDRITSLGIALVGGILEQGYGIPVPGHGPKEASTTGGVNPLLGISWLGDKEQTGHPVLGFNW